MYIPLYNQVATLYETFLELRDLLNDDKEIKLEITQLKIDDLEKAFNYFKQETIRIRNEGLGAFLIGHLEEEVLELRNFVEKSLKEKENNVKTSVRIAVNIFGINLSTTKTISKTKFTIIPQSLPFLTPWVDLTTQSTIVSAPIGSSDFEQQFIESCVIIKEIIPEVTLGQVK